MNELGRFADPWDWYGLRVWRHPERSRLVGRLRRIEVPSTIPCLRGYAILRALLGEDVECAGYQDLSHAYQRLLLVEWLTSFRELGRFHEFEIRAYAER